MAYVDKGTAVVGTVPPPPVPAPITGLSVGSGGGVGVGCGGIGVGGRCAAMDSDIKRNEERNGNKSVNMFVALVSSTKHERVDGHELTRIV